MAERPMVFSAPMVRALLAGRKTQARRVVRPQPPSLAECAAAYTSYGLVPAVSRSIKAYSLNDYDRLPKEPGAFDVDGAVGFVRDRCGQSEWACPHGVPGDVLWVRETWCPLNLDYQPAPRALPVPKDGRRVIPAYRADHRDPAGDAGPLPWRTAAEMPRWASRITLEITGVRVERRQEITDADCVAEGTPGFDGRGDPAGDDGMDPREEYRALWDRLNGKRAPWDSNPWVFVIEFRRIDDATARKDGTHG